MRTDEFLTLLQKVHNSKELVDLLVQASALEPPLPVEFPARKDTKLACTKNTPWVSAGSRATPTEWQFQGSSNWTQYPGNAYSKVVKYKVLWEKARIEEIDKRLHEAYGFVYVY